MSVKRDLLRNYFILICVLKVIADKDEVKSANTSPYDLGACPLPNPVADKIYGWNCEKPRSFPPLNGGTLAPSFTEITSICNPGYTRENGSNMFQSGCLDNKWSPPIPECKKICERLFPSEDLIVKCYKDEEEIDCHQPLSSGTEVRATCKPYRRRIDTQSENRIVCGDGQWNGTLPECVLECGKIDGDDITRKVSGDGYNYNHFPWHVAIYDVSSSPVLICAGSIISPIFIVTAATCVNNTPTEQSPDAKNFEIIVAKVTPDYYFQDNEFQKTYKVRKIHPQDIHSRIYDVAILEVVDEISFGYGVSPICYILKTYDHYYPSSRKEPWKPWSLMTIFRKTIHILQDAPGQVPSWGIIDTNNVREVDFRIDEYVIKAFQYCTNDENKFCGQQTYGAGTNISDTGAGFIYYNREDEQYHLVGVMNQKYRFQNNFTVICTDLNTKQVNFWMDQVLEEAYNQRVIDEAALNFKTKPECEYTKAFDVKLQLASACFTRRTKKVILPCKRTCDKLSQPQGMLLTCTYNDIEINCDQELTSGVKVSFRCIDGHKPKHQMNYQSIECQENGKWSNQLYPCIRDDIRSCALPPATEDKTYTIDCDPSIKYTQSDEYVKELTMLSFHCNPGYYYRELAPKNEDFFCEPNIHYKEKLNNFQVLCLNGTWTPRIENCAKLCKVFTSINSKPECYYNNKQIDCNQPLFPGTRMRLICEKYFSKKYRESYANEHQFEELTCNENGEWNGFPTECVPHCDRSGVVGEMYKEHEILSQISIVDKEIDSPICAGTLISLYLVMTAAGCFYNPVTKRFGDPNRYMITFKKRKVKYDQGDFVWQHNAKTYQVKTIYHTNKGKTKVIANYSEDLAVLEMVQKIELDENITPACVDWHQFSNYNLDIFEEKIPKWQRSYFKNDESGIEESWFRADYFPIEYSTCPQLTPNKSTNDSDLFCVRTIIEDPTSENQMLESSDYGAGFIQIRGRNKEYRFLFPDEYYVIGVLSLIPANASIYQLISTNYHAKWLNMIRLYVEKRRTFDASRTYFDVDSFHRKDDCRDGSPHLEYDSDPQLRISCNGSSTNRHFSSGCKLPERNLHNIDYKHICPSNIYKNYCQGVGENESVPQFTRLNYHCVEGYADPASGSTNGLVSFCDDGWLNPITTCKKSCTKLKPINVKLTCYYNAAPVRCDGNLGQDTVVFPECIPEYEPEYNPRYKEITCLPNGRWSDALYRCKPKCGKSATNVTPLIRGGGEARFGEFPWHVAIYDKTKSNLLICGGSIISPHVIVSAAHCFYQEERSALLPASNYIIAAGKISRDYKKKDSEVTEFYEIEKIIVENYLGVILRFQFDIAILQIKDRIKFNPQVIPVCLRQSGTTIIPSGEILHVAGWGLDDTDEPSSTLRAAAMPYISINECLQKVQDHLLGFISTDKFCVENAHGSIVDQGDSGGGLSRVEKVSSLHYLVGIVSYRAADSPTIAVITDITQDRYIRWISQQMNEIHRAKHYDI